MMTNSDALPAIAARLGATRPLVVLDLETTGTSVQNDRIVEIAIAKWALPPSFDAVTVKTRRLNPGMPIPKGATAVHGIRDDDVKECPTFAAIAYSLAEQLTGCDFAGYNVRSYDLPLLSTEFARCGMPFDFSAVKVLDAKELFFRREPRDLAAAVKFYTGNDFTSGHNALNDIGAAAAVLLGQMDRYGDMPATVSGLADYCLNRAPESLTDCGRLAWLDGAARITFGAHAGKPLADMVNVPAERQYLRWVIDKDFPLDVKKLLSECLEGRFPEKPEGVE